MGNRGPSPRRAMLTRARSLRGDRSFRDALERDIGRWNEQHPAFAVRGHAEHPDAIWAPLSPFAYPDPLRETLEAFDELSAVGAIRGAAVRPIALPDVPPGTPDVFGTYEAAASWRALVLRICRDWWPAGDFPSWLPAGHPASRFVSECLLLDPREISEDRILSTAPEMLKLSFDPADPSSNPGVMLHWDIIQGLVERLKAAARDGELITTEVIDREVVEAISVAVAERRADQKGEYWYVQVFPGMTTTDWRAMETKVREASIMRQPDRRASARRLAHDSSPKLAIARKLGVHRRQVDRYLD